MNKCAARGEKWNILAVEEENGRKTREKPGEMRKVRKGTGEWILRKQGGGIKIYAGLTPCEGGAIVAFDKKSKNRLLHKSASTYIMYYHVDNAALCGGVTPACRGRHIIQKRSAGFSRTF